MKPRVKEWRTHLGLSQEDLARITDLTASAISKIERRGTNRISTVRRICKGMNISYEDIYAPPPPVAVKSAPADVAKILMMDHATFNGQTMPEEVMRLSYEHTEYLMSLQSRLQSELPANE